MAYGPAASDSATLDQLLKTWTQTYQRQTNRKSRFITESFRVTSSAIQGDWVEQWGYYSFTDVTTGQAITFPFHYTDKVARGKIVGDRIYYDELSVLRQLGYQLVPPRVTKK